ncbi:uncharacterized protein LOC131665634 [Phymastichus coffea]|uniref:uncharacterized protein LOC131665634 n=1 Tax=Phymastichus coffea TaxID=108790 RepID=UPI00273C091C|nr:uncharacterized protein LOC131665634 [Phymastichus coffea]
MYSTKMALQSFIFLSMLIIYSIDQVSALNCYICASDSDGECYKNPKQDRFIMDCVNTQSVSEFSNNFLAGVGGNVQSIIADYTRSRQLNIFDHTCLTIIGDLAGKRSVVRACSPKFMKCREWEGKFGSLQIESCDQCESDYCNSSHHLSVGFLSLIGSLLAILCTRI